MSMVENGERPLRILVVHGKFKGGFHIAFVPAELRPERVEVALREAGIDIGAIFELHDWHTTSDNLAVAYVPFPGNELTACACEVPLV